MGAEGCERLVEPALTGCKLTSCVTNASSAFPSSEVQGARTYCPSTFLRRIARLLGLRLVRRGWRVQHPPQHVILFRLIGVSHASAPFSREETLKRLPWRSHNYNTTPRTRSPSSLYHHDMESNGGSSGPNNGCVPPTGFCHCNVDVCEPV